MSDYETKEARWLLEQEYPPDRWLIDTLLPEGADRPSTRVHHACLLESFPTNLGRHAALARSEERAWSPSQLNDERRRQRRCNGDRMPSA